MQNEGHRQRLLKRFESGGLDGLHDYEIIELFLTHVIPRRDTKPVAKELLKRYRSVSGVLNAAPSELTTVAGIGGRAALFLTLVREIASYCLREKYSRQSVLTKRSDVEEYLRFSIGMKSDEYVAALYLDSGNHCVATEIVAEGTVNQCAIYPRLVVQRGLAHGAAGIILAHNHPGGAPGPSAADWRITERLSTVGKLLDMPLIDHIIICGDTTISLRDLPKWPAK
ncbi:MAG: DNA repair protein RadC [Chitinivibrionales bacterium]|nr:DNA repair protein RadC [Chitinivibrionales bacterium]MBD3394445.1 DNA repair protein RadC [Chitinivibrionales bacterium]